MSELVSMDFKRSPYISTKGVARVIVALGGFVLYFVAQACGSYIFFKYMDPAFALFGAHLLACVVMGGLYLILRRNDQTSNSFRGENFSFRALAVGVAGVVILYVLSYGFVSLIGQPAEPFMADFMVAIRGGQAVESVSLLVLIAVLAPFGEELAFRHFLMNVFPFNNAVWKSVAIVVTALVFTAIHLQYSFVTTLVSLFVLALMLAYARVFTGGLLVPMVMHACASILAVGLYPVFYS
ncbi:CPBP family intramembrane metalloprotease [Pseudomonas sp. ANT_J12]|uniref:CPBP family intramembrane glutamic endopeptidase n=1 Tax=Pseudomonas sp. ANT_J12 TaxID=2597351 RepID=UPI0011F2AC0F|nr:type II CAAX endopeptidase family protein [Pseudomonas sp. ANT_J12]KAA0995964.1 CPBP family intramembrane metalloprotease [Pseudomonas sp. ANT_J12]